MDRVNHELEEFAVRATKAHKAVIDDLREQLRDAESQVEVLDGADDKAWPAETEQQIADALRKVEAQLAEAREELQSAS